MLRPSRLLSILLAFTSALAADAAPRWRTLRAPHCTVLSQLSEEETRKWASSFEQFIAAAKGFLVVDETALPPLTVMLFAEGCFDHYKPLDSEKEVRTNVAGVFGGGSSDGVIALAETQDYYKTRHILFHESTHWLLTGSRTQVPLWLNEGLAEAFATFEPGAEFGTLGLSIGAHVDLLKTTGWIPWAEIVRTTHHSPLYQNNDHVRHFYAQSWLFAHRLLFLDTETGAAALDRHTRARLHGANPTRAFAIAIEKNFDLVEAQMLEYVHTTRFTPRRLPCPPQAAVTTPYERASPLVVETALAEIATGSRRFETALIHIGRVRALAPTSPAAPELVADYERAHGNTAAAANAARQALDLGSRNTTMLTLVADRELDLQLAPSAGNDEALRHLAAPYLRAAAMDPRSDSAYCGFARVATRLSAPTAADIQLLTTGREFFPDSAWPFVGLAAISAKQGNVAETQRLLALALTRPEIGDRIQSQVAKGGKPAVSAATAAARIEALTKSARFDEAIGEFASMLATPIAEN